MKRLTFVTLAIAAASDRFEPWGQLLAARGYAVLYPNVRGSTAYGRVVLRHSL